MGDTSIGWVVYGSTRLIPEITLGHAPLFPGVSFPASVRTGHIPMQGAVGG